MRQPWQVLVIPWRIKDNKIEYCILKRKENWWQFIAGGGESKEDPVDAAIRETMEETGISAESDIIKLDAYSTIPVKNVVGYFMWGRDVFMIPEYAFGAKWDGEPIKLSDEHVYYEWVSYKKAHSILKWDSNRTALWELNERLLRKRGIV